MSLPDKPSIMDVSTAGTEETFGFTSATTTMVMVQRFPQQVQGPARVPVRALSSLTSRCGWSRNRLLLVPAWLQEDSGPSVLQEGLCPFEVPDSVLHAGSKYRRVLVLPPASEDVWSCWMSSGPSPKSKDVLTGSLFLSRRRTSQIRSDIFWTEMKGGAAEEDAGTGRTQGRGGQRFCVPQQLLRFRETLLDENRHPDLWLLRLPAGKHNSADI